MTHGLTAEEEARWDRAVESGEALRTYERLIGMDPVVTFEADRSCSRCDRRRDDLEPRAHGELVCGSCRRLERARYEQATGVCALACGYELRFHRGPTCPTELDARAMAGDR